MQTPDDPLLQLLHSLDIQDAAGRTQQLQNLQVSTQNAGVQTSQLQPVVDSLVQLIKDSNHKVSQQAISALQAVINAKGQDLIGYSSCFLPTLLDRLGDAKQPVRDAATAALHSILQSWGAAATLPKLALSWYHRNARVRQGMLQAVTETIAAAPVSLSLPDSWAVLVLKPAAELLEDPNSAVREAAIDCIEELHQQLGDTVMDHLQVLPIQPAQLKGLQARFSQLSSNSQIVQDYPLFQAVTTEPEAQQLDSMTSRSDCSSQNADAASVTTTSYSPNKHGFSRTSTPPPLQERSRTNSHDLAKGSAALPKTVVRRGGFMDSGGLTAAGELPEAAPIWVESIRDLKPELERLVIALDEKQEWTKRIEAMLRLEGLVRGGAAGLEGFLDTLKPLRQPLTIQLNDRRSAVSKQACRILGLLAAALGPSFDLWAVYFLPILFKITVITVQVMADAADLCCHTLVHHCPSARLLKPVADALCTDKNAKLRQCCAKYMLQILEDWEADTCIKGLDLVEVSIRSAAQDSSSDTRAIGRSMYAAYARTLPARAEAFLRRMDTALQEKLSQATLTYIPGQYQPPLTGQPKLQQSKSALPAACSLPLPNSPTLPSRPPSGKSGQARSMTASAAASFSSEASRPGSQKGRLRRSVGGAALRILSSSTQNEDFEPATSTKPAARSALSARRVSCMPPPAPVSHSRAATRNPSAVPPTPSAAAGAKRVVHAALPSWEDPQRLQSDRTTPHQQQPCSQLPRSEPSEHFEAAATDHAQLSARSDAWIDAVSAPSASRVLTMAAAAGTDWKARAEVFIAMHQLFQPDAQTPLDLASCSEKLVQLLLEHIGDAHFKVASAALEAAQAALQHHPHLVEPSLDRLMPLLAQRITDPKEAVRTSATGCLQSALRHYAVEVSLPQLTRCLDVLKMAKTRCALLDVFTAHCGHSVTTAAALPALRVWVGRVAGLVGDRKAEVRRAACQALHLVYTRMDGPTLLTHIAHASPPDQMTLRRALIPMLPNLEAQLIPYSNNRAAHRSAPSQGPSAPNSPPEAQQPAQSAFTDLPYDVDNGGSQVQHAPSPLMSEFSLSSIRQEASSVHLFEQQQSQDGSQEHRQQARMDLLSCEQSAATLLGDVSHQHRQQAGMPLQSNSESASRVHGAVSQQHSQQATVGLQLHQQSAPLLPFDQQSSQQHRQQTRVQLHSHQLPAPKAESAAPSGLHTRVTVNTTGAIRKTVFTVAQHQPTEQQEMPSPVAQTPDTVAQGLLLPPTSAASLQAPTDQYLVVRPQSHASHALTHRGLNIQSAAQQGQERGMAGSRLNLDPVLCVPQQLPGLSAASLDRGVLQNSAYINAPHDRAAPNSPGKAAPNSPGRHSRDAPNSPGRLGGAALDTPTAEGLGIRQSGNAVQLAQSDPFGAQPHAHVTDMGHNSVAASGDDSLGARTFASRDSLLLGAVEAVCCADEATQLQALQDLQHQIGLSEGPVLKACLPQVMSAVLPLLHSSSWQNQRTAITTVKGLAGQGPALQPWLPALVAALLQAVCHSRPEVCMAADEVLGAVLPQQPSAAALALLKVNLPTPGTVSTPACPPTPLVQASVKNIGRVVQRMPSADLLPELQSPDLLPGLFEAFDHHSADVRKAVTMCLMYMWQVMDDELKPFLTGLRVSKIKLVTAYVDQAQAQRRRFAAQSSQA